MGKATGSWTVARPFVKWAGGKARLAPAIVERAPHEFGRYFEPFAGGAAVYFALWNARGPFAATLADANTELMECYRTVRDRVDALVAKLGELERTHQSLDEPERRDHYYAMRSASPSNEIDQAARLIFLNRTGYNGLYRVNRSGKFNVPYGRYSQPRILREEVLRACSEALAGVQLETAGFDAAIATAQPGDLVYFDPPYVPLSKTSNFTQYAREDFGPSAQELLRDCMASLSERGVAVLLSNSDHDAVRCLYSGHGFHAETVTMSRAINSATDRRKAIPELLIDNLGRTEVGSAFGDALPGVSSTRRPL